MAQDIGTTAALGAQRFVALTSFKRSGDPVTTTVWVARDGDELIVLTPTESWKVKRIRRDPRVTVAPCSRSGKIPPGAQPAEGAAIVEPDPAETQRLWDVIKRKYGLEYRVVTSVERLFGGRRDRVVLRVRLTP